MDNNIDLSDFLEAAKPEEPLTSCLEYEQDRQERPLYNDPSPAVVLQKEQASHRLIAFLKAQGLSNVEIGQRVGKSPVAVGYICKQPCTAAIIVEEIALAGRSEVEVVLQGAALDSVNKLIEIRDDADASKDVQRKAANDLLDRVFGKPNQPMTHANVDLDTLSDAELAKIAKSGKHN